MLETNKLRFRSGTKIPDIPDELKLVRFEGQPAAVPQQLPGENVVGNSSLTRRQIEALGYLARMNTRSLPINEERLADVALYSQNPAISERIDKFRDTFNFAVSQGEQNLASSLIRQALIMQEFAI